ncbi:hypothetical protein KM043_004421 [Ampulex compressa]|nr:hypothetical protein KM043_004421 [Ampulex compressa]
MGSWKRQLSQNRGELSLQNPPDKHSKSSPGPLPASKVVLEVLHWPSSGAAHFIVVRGPKVAGRRSSVPEIHYGPTVTIVGLMRTVTSNITRGSLATRPNCLRVALPCCTYAPAKRSEHGEQSNPR